MKLSSNLVNGGGGGGGVVTKVGMFLDGKRESTPSHPYPLSQLSVYIWIKQCYLFTSWFCVPVNDVVISVLSCL